MEWGKGIESKLGVEDLNEIHLLARSSSGSLNGDKI